MRKAALAVTLVSIFAAFSSTALAQVNYGDFIGTGVNFLNVTETTQSPADPAALWGPPAINGANLVFSPPAFESVCSAGSSDITASLLTTMIVAQPGSTLFGFWMTEAGEVTLTRAPPPGDPSSNASVSMGGFLTVIEDNNGPIAPVVIPFAGTFLPADTYSLPTDSGTTPWTGSVLVDVAAHVPNATRAILQLNDTLDANCGDGTTDGTIRKTPTVAVSVGVTPPARFTVGKSFSDGNTDDVTVELTCTSGEVIADDATASATDPADFIISGFEPGATCTAIENPVPPGYSNATGELCTNQLIVEGEETTCTLVNSQNAVQVTVFKTYTDGAGAPVDVTLGCTSGTIDSNPKPSSPGAPAIFTVSDFLVTGADCWATEDGPAPGYYLQAETCGDSANPGMAIAVPVGGTGSGDDDCSFTNAPTRAIFNVTKIFSDSSEDVVTVSLECNDGFISQDGSAQVSGGDLAGHTFIITDFTDGAMDCTVTESGSPDGYTVFPAEGCVFENVVSSQVQYDCMFYNAAKPAIYTVTKDWTVTNEGGNAVKEKVWVTIECDAPIDFSPPTDPKKLGPPVPPPPYRKSGWLGDGDTLTASVYTYRGDAMCHAYEDIVQSGVESENECADYETLSAGETYDCTIYNTVFFEGIPTLSQWGMALMALLILGVGLVSFRRFV